MAQRQFSGLPMPRQLWWAEEYVRRFPRARLRFGPTPADDVRVVNLPSYPLDEDAAVLRDMDTACYAEALGTRANVGGAFLPWWERRITR